MPLRGLKIYTIEKTKRCISATKAFAHANIYVLLARAAIPRNRSLRISRGVLRIVGSSYEGRTGKHMRAGNEAKVTREGDKRRVLYNNPKREGQSMVASLGPARVIIGQIAMRTDEL